MSSTNSAPGMLWRFALVSRSFLSQPGLPFAEALPEERIEQAFAAEEIDFAGPSVDEDGVVYTPAVTLRAFLSQMLHADEQRSCLAAVARVNNRFLTPFCPPVLPTVLPSTKHRSYFSRVPYHTQISPAVPFVPDTVFTPFSPRFHRPPCRLRPSGLGSCRDGTCGFFCRFGEPLTGASRLSRKMARRR